MRRLLFAFMFVLTYFFPAGSWAGPTVIRDNRLQDTGITPTLGRGYSIATNTYQSQCISSVVASDPSYDLKYEFVEIDRNWESSFTRSSTVNASFSRLFIKANVSFSSTASGTDTHHYHYLFANIGIDSYYNALNEAYSHMSSSARDLIEKGDVVGFFESCGPYYVRSIGRHSSYLAMLRYRSTSTTRDYSFEASLKAHLRALFTSANVSASYSGEFKKKIEESELNITVWAQGLNKDDIADIIPTDIDSFKESIKNAIHTMQDPDAGRVTSIEVVPWVENTDFQDALEVFKEVSSSDGTQTQRIPDVRTKLNLEDNSELIAELNRIDRAQINQYFRAVNCRNSLLEKYLEVEQLNLTGSNTSMGKFYDPKAVYFSDLKRPGDREREISLEVFTSILSKERVDKYLEDNNMFHYGEASPRSSGNPSTGAIHCVNTLTERDIGKVNFRDIPSCVAARNTVVPISPLLDNYCMPELARVEP